LVIYQEWIYKAWVLLEPDWQIVDYIWHMGPGIRVLSHLVFAQAAEDW